MDVASKNWNGRNEGTLSFFFFQIPKSHEDMFKAFSYYGDVVEFIIPSERNRRGLRKIIIGAKKIYVNVPRFQRVFQEAVGGRRYLERMEAEKHATKVQKAVEIPHNEQRKEDQESVVPNAMDAIIDP